MDGVLCATPSTLVLWTGYSPLPLPLLVYGRGTLRYPFHSCFMDGVLCATPSTLVLWTGYSALPLSACRSERLRHLGAARDSTVPKCYRTFWAASPNPTGSHPLFKNKEKHHSDWNGVFLYW